MKKGLFFRYLLMMSLADCCNLFAISTVYNFRIAQITKQPIMENNGDTSSILTGLLFDTYLKKYTGGIRQNFIGGLGSYIYNFASTYYFRADLSVSHIHETTHHRTTFCGVMSDDLLFTLGKNFKVNNFSKITVSGLFGIPTHKIEELGRVSFGYGQVGTGIQLDGLYEFKREIDFLYGLRYLYFVPGKVHDCLKNDYKFSLGNIADLLVGLKKNWNHHGIEGGYTARWNFGAHVFPEYDDIIARTNYARNNFYVVYKYKFATNRVSHRILLNIGYGFDSKPKNYGNKDIITCWTSWSINF